MAEVEEPQFNSLAERIAALNRQKNFQAPPSTAGKRPPPPPPPDRSASSTQRATRPAAVETTAQKSPSIPPRPTRSSTDKPPLPRRTTTTEDGESQAAAPVRGRGLAPPPMPTRNSQNQVSPALPPRRTSTQTLSTRRNSNSSDISYLSTVSNLSLTQTASSATSVGGDPQPLRKLPPALGETKLPPLPPTRRELEQKAKETAEREAAEQAQRSPVPPPRPTPTTRASEPARPSLPPRLPSRPARSPATQEVEEPTPALPTRRLPPPSSTGPKSALTSGFGTRPKPADDAPPPVPTGSRPTLAQIDAAKNGPARPASAPPAVGNCLLCRDFSGPDNVAAQYPAHGLPRQDPIGYLAHVLCDPFPSPTDKARAIFTWLHHNIAYNVKDFMAGTIPRGETAEDTIFSGKAVCAGYANVYEEIAYKAGLECVVVCGHGKGFGYEGLKPGQSAPPPDPTGHAWNAVRIDGGEWKLLDACWGAGHITTDAYHKNFNPSMFCMSNEDFGLKHFPQEDEHFYRKDRRILTWEEYYLGPQRGEKATWYGSASEDGFDEATFQPQGKYISINSGQVVRFQVSKVCEHWDPVKNGAGPSRLLLLEIHGVDGRKKEHIPLDSDGFYWHIDVPARSLGAPGQKVMLLGLDSFEGKTGRGVPKQLFIRKKGRVAMSWIGVGEWELVA